MPKTVVSYDKDLPEIPDRQPDQPPTAYLRKKPGRGDEFEVVEGRRPSKLLLIGKLRGLVSAWREGGYPGASDVTKRLFAYWFDEEHLVDDAVFSYYFGQREAIETLAYLVDVKKVRDIGALVRDFGEIFYPDGTQRRLGEVELEIQTGTSGQRMLRRYVPEAGSEVVQDLPPEGLRRFAFKMATGSGKTVVMAMVMVLAYFHKRMVSASPLSTNFLLLSPNVIVHQRLERDFARNRIFRQLPLVPPEWFGQFNLKVILRGESGEPDPSGNLFLTNVHQVYQSRDEEWTPANAVEALLGPKPSKDLGASERSMLERVKSLPDLRASNKTFTGRV